MRETRDDDTSKAGAIFSRPGGNHTARKHRAVSFASVIISCWSLLQMELSSCHYCLVGLLPLAN